MYKKEKYRLQIVVKQKRDARDQAAKNLADKRSIFILEKKVEDQLKLDLQLNLQRRKEEYEGITNHPGSSTMEVQDVQRRLNYIKKLDFLADSLRKKIEKQKEKVKQADLEVARALRKLVQASRELQVMENHKENWQKKAKREKDLRDQKDMNEIGNVMYNNNRSI